MRYPSLLAGRAYRLLVGLALLGASGPARAQAVARDKAGAVSASGTPAPPKPAAWHDSLALWTQRASTQTLGIGGDVQTRDPFYDWNFYLRPRYYLWENERSSLSLRGQLWTSVEFTNSDSTTKEHEFVIEDTLLSVVPEHAFVLNGEYVTDLTLSLPRLVLPTSKASYQSGNIVQVGARAFLLQAFPLREREPLLPRAHAALRVGYGYQFARAVVPERSALNRFRMDSDGHSVSNDQLAGAALSEHAVLLHGLLGADLWRDKLAIEGEAGIDPAVRFALPAVAPICTVRTGCVEPQTVADPQRLSVATFLDLYVEVRSFGGALKTALGYENITSQLGLGGQRRSLLASPDAKLYLKLEFQPDLLFEKPVAVARRASPTRAVASVR